jgi:hypothetical protein
MRLRAKLRGRARTFNKSKRRRKGSGKSSSVQNIKTIYEPESVGELRAAIRWAERIDEHNRGLLGLMKIYEHRMEKAGLLITPQILTEGSLEEGTRGKETSPVQHEQHESEVTVVVGDVIEYVSEYPN